jgi:hypothetical protein
MPCSKYWDISNKRLTQPTEITAVCSQIDLLEVLHNYTGPIFPSSYALSFDDYCSINIKTAFTLEALLPHSAAWHSRQRKKSVLAPRLRQYLA